jgi:hypothetical protein
MNATKTIYQVSPTGQICGPYVAAGERPSRDDSWSEHRYLRTAEREARRRRRVVARTRTTQAARDDADII